MAGKIIDLLVANCSRPNEIEVLEFRTDGIVSNSNKQIVRLMRWYGTFMPENDIAIDTFILKWFVCEPSTDESLLLFYNSIRNPLVNMYSNIRLV